MKNKSTLLLIFISFSYLSACGDSDGNEEGAIGAEGSLHEGIESLMIHEMTTIDNRIAVEQVEPQIVTREADTADSKSNSKSKDESTVSIEFSMFDYYPNKSYSARNYKSMTLVTRDDCLNICKDDAICGSVSYVSISSLCKLHGPNMPWYDFSDEPVRSDAEAATQVDTYIFRDRNGDSVADNIYFEIDGQFGKHGLEKGATMYIKFLYVDKTASPWIAYQTIKGSSQRKGDLFGVAHPVAFKAAEAIVYASNSKKLSSLNTISGNYNSAEFHRYDSDYIKEHNFFFSAVFPFRSNYDGITIDPKCKNGSSNQCTDIIILPTTKDSNVYTETGTEATQYTQMAKYRHEYAY